MSRINDKAEYCFSNESSLADTESITSGWIDFQEVDKYQFEAKGSTAGSGFTLTLDSSSSADGTGSTLQSVTPITQEFYLFNVIARQRYLKFTWTNNSGTTVSDAYVAIKKTYGSSDKLSVFPLANEPTNFSQAALVQAVNKGQQPDGDYVNEPADGLAISTTDTLAGDATYTSAWQDSDGWNSIELFIESDVESAEQGVEVQFTDDAQAGAPTVRASQFYTFNGTSVTRGFFSISIPPILDGFRIKYTNGADAQSSFYLSATLKVNSENNTFNAGGAILTSEFLTEVALGNISNYSTGIITGRNPDVDTNSTPEDMWTVGGTYTGHPTSFTPETIDVFSSSANDTSAGTGARTIRIHGLKTTSSTKYETEDLTMNGVTAVTSSNTWWRIRKAEVLTAGSGGQNAGNITVRSTTTTANVFTQIPTGFNQSQSAVYTVPAGKKLLIKRLRTALTKSGGAAGSGTVSFRVRSSGGVYKAIRVFELQAGAVTEFASFGGDVVEAGSDVKFKIESVSSNDSVLEAVFEFVLLDE